MNVIDIIDVDFRKHEYGDSFREYLDFRVYMAPTDKGCDIGFFVVEHIRYWSPR